MARKALHQHLGSSAGFLFARHPAAGAVVPPNLAVLLGIQGAIVGIMPVAMAFRGGGWGMGTLGALSIILGTIPVPACTSLATAMVSIWVAGMFLNVGGVIWLVQAFRRRRSAQSPEHGALPR